MSVVAISLSVCGAACSLVCTCVCFSGGFVFLDLLIPLRKQTASSRAVLTGLEGLAPVMQCSHYSSHLRLQGLKQIFSCHAKCQGFIRSHFLNFYTINRAEGKHKNDLTQI